MNSHPVFVQHALPEVKTGNGGYEEWAASPVVSAVKYAFDRLGRSDPETRKQLLSLSTPYYPSSWIQKL